MLDYTSGLSTDRKQEITVLRAVGGVHWNVTANGDNLAVLGHVVMDNDQLAAGSAAWPDPLSDDAGWAYAEAYVAREINIDHYRYFDIKAKRKLEGSSGNFVGVVQSAANAGNILMHVWCRLLYRMA